MMVLASCGRDDDADLYQVSYQSPTTETIELDSTDFTVSSNSIVLGEKLGFTFPALDQDVTWVIDLVGTSSGATSKLVYVSKELNPTLNSWSGEYDGDVPFLSTESVQINVSIYQSDVTIIGALVQLK